MKALFLDGIKSLRMGETEAPRAPEGWVCVRVRRVGICGSDVHYFMTGHIGEQIVQYPFILGHESSGEVLDGVGKFPSGMPVFIEPAITCQTCEQCGAGRENTCLNLKFLGNPLETPGSMREEICMPAHCIVPLPEGIGLDEGVLLEPLSIALHAVRRAAMRPGCRVGIVGAGPIGLSVLTALDEARPREVFVSDPVAPRRAAATALGATAVVAPTQDGAAPEIRSLSQGGVDVAFECVGSQETIDDAVAMLRPGGVLVIVGITEGHDRITFNPHYIRRRELTLVNVRRQNRCVPGALDILTRRRDAARVLITHHFPPARANEAFNLVQQRRDGVIKALLEF